jgi:peptidoglycan/xylan/chitin deacetylase (PgdA/CDA1 family)
LLKSVATSAPARVAFRSALSQPPLVLTYHRFSGVSNGGRGMPAAALRRQLEVLTSEGFTVVPLSELVDAIAAHRELPPRSVVLTVDDGYEDFATNGAPIFLEYDVPVTVFLTTGFLDRKIWMWWDQLDVATTASRSTDTVLVDGAPFPLAWPTEGERRLAAHRLAQHVERMPTVQREGALRSIFRQLDWTPPPQPPPEFQSMSWDQVRHLETAGIRFGAHTVTHPILALSDEAQVQYEIEESRARLTAEVRWPVPVLAYPNGDSFARGPREVACARRAGLVAAVTMNPRFVTSRTLGGDPYDIPRAPVPEDIPSFLQLVAGPEALRQRLRGLS